MLLASFSYVFCPNERLEHVAVDRRHRRYRDNCRHHNRSVHVVPPLEERIQQGLRKELAIGAGRELAEVDDCNGYPFRRRRGRPQCSPRLRGPTPGRASSTRGPPFTDRGRLLGGLVGSLHFGARTWMMRGRLQVVERPAFAGIVTVAINAGVAGGCTLRRPTRRRPPVGRPCRKTPRKRAVSKEWMGTGHRGVAGGGRCHPHSTCSPNCYSRQKSGTSPQVSVASRIPSLTSSVKAPSRSSCLARSADQL